MSVACQWFHRLADGRGTRRYYLLIGLMVAPLLAVGNAYGAGLTDWNMASLYTKVSCPGAVTCLVHSTMSDGYLLLWCTFKLHATQLL